MTTLEQPSGTTGSVHMRGALDIYAASTVRERLVALVQQHPVLELQLSEVDEIDVAGLQLLLAAKQMASNLGHALKLSSHSAAVLDALQLCSLLPYFGDPVVEHGAAKAPKDKA
ncbi:MAG: STAS domain-containing protein [Thiomonas sp.]|uniref:Putative Sulfate transporter/antisigma-factor antagonist STAS n=1 Tax=mine drainage metagenome TaxID=410659 RepID=E6PM85_9ZZZZ